MSKVNADVSELLQALNSINVALNSIGNTKSSIAKKYQQLSDSWKDKKYNELGSVVSECNKALNDALKSLQTAEKYISAYIENAISCIKDNALVEFMEKELKAHDLIESKLVAKLEELTNEWKRNNN